MVILLSSKLGENEVSVEWFLKLKEFDSLSRMRINHLKLIKEQEDRLSALEEKQKEASLRTVKLKQDHHELQQKLYETEKKLKQSEEQKQRLIDIGGDESKIKNFEKEAMEAEEQGLELLSQIETNEVELTEVKQFMEGLKKTTDEISHEVNEEKNKEQKELDQIEMRLNLIREELPEDFRRILDKTVAKNLAIGPFTRIESGSCFFCRYKISRTDESEIDMQKGLKTCPQCSRIFLPYGA
jgi:predicted  nucleic acid-binding Zn-ribbon protein